MGKLIKRICGIGYGWYVAFKVFKAFCAIPVLAVRIVWAVILACVLLVYCTFRTWLEIIFEDIPVWFSGYTRTRWFTGFSRQHYNKIYRSQLTALPTEQIND
ncbi:hypothetical protein [Stenotrophomonas sp. UBA7606]|uniref:hypothetical protein n=1 Tax=Stenotrophomonas sp. UBA7606 TaxID=1947559 RepID=UPI0025DF9EC9|nr:hypothetical protein [Stenotrophomonas sp. UBA7606]